jgi:uncharacterized protein
VRLARPVALLVVVITATAVAAAAVAAEPRRFEQGRLFRIDRAGVPPSFVFGTMHSNDERVIALAEPVVRALAQCRTAAFETLIAQGDAHEFFAAARHEDDRRLSDDLGAERLATLRDALGPAAPDRETLEASKPWAALLRLAQPQRSGPAPLDALLKIEARERRLVVIGLELPDEQVASLDAIPHRSQIALLEWALATRDARPAELEATTRAWLAGDLAGLRALAVAPGADDPALRPHFAALMKHLIADRNALMAHRLHLPLMRGRVFVAVGALHLPGRDGLLALIERQGYRVRRIL